MSPIGKSRLAAVAFAVLVAAGVVILAVRPGSETVSGLPVAQVVPDDVPDHRLLEDALYIDAWQSQQSIANFTALPASRPPALARMLIGGGGEAILDAYHANSGIVVIVAFSAQPLMLCDEPGSSVVCLREQRLAESLLPDEMALDGESQEGAGALRHLTVYATHGQRAPSAGDAGLEELRDFWADVQFVRSTDAVWFAQLLSAGESAVHR